MQNALEAIELLKANSSRIPAALQGTYAIECRHAMPAQAQQKGMPEHAMV
jgi:hypothetical protein